MTRILWPISVLLICLPVALLAIGVPLPFLTRNNDVARPLPVPSGDQELAWFHTTTSGTTWERFVAGIVRSKELVAGLDVDDSSAFLDHTTSAPEVVISRTGWKGKLRIRWYKLSNEATPSQWISSLAQRNPPPLAVIGGGSSDRAVDLANALVLQESWKGERPLLLITTATADEIAPDQIASLPNAKQPLHAMNLVDLYQGSSFRFCFTNRQMAEAVLDFIWSTPGLRPEMFRTTALAGLSSGLATIQEGAPNRLDQPHIFSIFWQDDPYSTDLHDQFKITIAERTQLKKGVGTPNGNTSTAQFATWSVPFSIGGFSRPNAAEFQAAQSILEEARRLPPQRSLLVVPTVTQPARRLLKTLAESSPSLDQRFVAVTGDGIPVNAIYRDGEFAWPLHTIRVPLVFFMHNNPAGWDPESNPLNQQSTDNLQPPNSTEDVLHFAELARVVFEASFPPSESTAESSRNVSQSSSGLSERLRQAGMRDQVQKFFDPSGNRMGGTGEYIVIVLPISTEITENRLNSAQLEIWQRGPGGRWQRVRTLEINQRMTHNLIHPDPGTTATQRHS